MPLWYLLLIMLALTGCMPPKDKLILERADFSQLKGWEESQEIAPSLVALERSCGVWRRLKTLPKVAELYPVSLADWQELCLYLPENSTSNEEARQWFETFFVPYRIKNNEKETGVFTGYYEATLYGSRTQNPTYFYPLYRMPPLSFLEDKTLDRAAIEEGALQNKGLEILYVDDPIEAFFLHIQGSGRVILPDGKEVCIGYAGQNGHPFVPIGREMVERGMLVKEAVSAPAIKEWLRSHPEQSWQIMALNPSYIFFQEIPCKGAIGAQGVVLTPEASLAVDKRFIPYGLPLWLETTLPLSPVSAQQEWRKLMISQDTGGAIRGPVRGDIFFGRGERAELLAGYMKANGTYFALLPK